VETNKVDETQEETEMALLKYVTSEKVKLRKIKLDEVYITFKVDTFVGQVRIFRKKAKTDGLS
jgi:hypothetical protein